MKVLAINGSPRKDWNTATLLRAALDGASAQGAETELVHLVDLDFKGCVSCFACKREGGKSYGRCARQDGLTPVLAEIERCDGLVIGSPIYLGDVTGAVRSFLERLAFQYLVYDHSHKSLYPGHAKVGFIYTMNVDEQRMRQIGYPERLGGAENLLRWIIGSVEPPVYSNDTLQFDDYSKYVTDMFDPQAKAERRRVAFPEDCRRAYELGERLAGKSE